MYIDTKQDWEVNRFMKRIAGFVITLCILTCAFGSAAVFAKDPGPIAPGASQKLDK